jgi:hypothetical protein
MPEPRPAVKRICEVERSAMIGTDSRVFCGVREVKEHGKATIVVAFLMGGPGSVQEGSAVREPPMKPAGWR